MKSADFIEIQNGRPLAEDDNPLYFLKTNKRVDLN